MDTKKCGNCNWYKGLSVNGKCSALPPTVVKTNICDVKYVIPIVSAAGCCSLWESKK